MKGAETGEHLPRLERVTGPFVAAWARVFILPRA